MEIYQLLEHEKIGFVVYQQCDLTLTVPESME